jgi:hypothetical protein
VDHMLQVRHTTKAARLQLASCQQIPHPAFTQKHSNSGLRFCPNIHHVLQVRHTTKAARLQLASCQQITRPAITQKHSNSESPVYSYIMCCRSDQHHPSCPPAAGQLPTDPAPCTHARTRQQRITSVFIHHVLQVRPTMHKLPACSWPAANRCRALHSRKNTATTDHLAINMRHVLQVTPTPPMLPACSCADAGRSRHCTNMQLQVNIRSSSGQHQVNIWSTSGHHQVIVRSLKPKAD